MRLLNRQIVHTKEGQDITFASMVSTTQKLKGVTSKIPGSSKHIVLMDIENVGLDQAGSVLKEIQKKYELSDFYITTDNRENSYHAWCFSQVSFRNLLHILTDSLEILDYGFFRWTVFRQAATLRTSKKFGRPSQKIVRVIRSFYVPQPSKIRVVEYTTGIEKFPLLSQKEYEV